jgi:hypothetical protein
MQSLQEQISVHVVVRGEIFCFCLLYTLFAGNLLSYSNALISGTQDPQLVPALRQSPTS